MNDTSLQIDPALVGSARVRILSTPLTRNAARVVTHLFPSLLTSTCCSYAGVVDFSISGIRIKYALGPNDPIGETLYWTGANRWEREVIPLFCDMARRADGLFLDVGANCGLYSILACAGNPKLRAIAWEPTDIRGRAGLNVKVNDLSERIEIRPAAVGRESGTATFFLHKDPTMGGFTDRSEEGKRIEVDLECLDAVIPPGVKVGLVKIDVEGHEREVFAGMRRVLTDSHPTVFFECLKPSEWGDSYELLRDSGYRVFALTRDGAIETSAHRQGTTNYLAQSAR